jgi:AraC-like DNA-binding protein
MDLLPDKSVGHFFGLPDAPTVTLSPVSSAIFSVSRLAQEVDSQHPVEVRIPSMNAYFMMVYLQDVHHCDILADQSHTAVRCYEKGSVCLVDLTDGASILLHSSLDALGIVLPRSLLSEVAEMYPSTRPYHLRCQRGEPDSVIAGLGTVLTSALSGKADGSGAIVPHIAIALCAHLLHNYTAAHLRNGLGASTLSAWQEKVAKEFMLDNLDQEISVASIAEVAGLSVGHFAHQFKKATGVTPHQWLNRVRIDEAIRLLGMRTHSIGTISRLCGFADQSHFTKAFARQTGLTPFVWLQSRLH